MRTVRALFAALVLLAASVQTSHATLSTFENDQAGWLAAIGGTPSFDVDFENVSADASYNGTATFDAGPFVLGSVGTDVGGAGPFNTVDVGPSFLLGPSIDGNDAVSRLGDNSTAITIAFDAPITAFAGDFQRISDSGTPIVLTLNRVGGGSDSALIPNIGTTTEFFGVVSDPADAYSSLTFTLQDSMVDDFWRMDNLAGLTAVPEPSACLFVGVVGLGIWSCRRRPNG